MNKRIELSVKIKKKQGGGSVSGGDYSQGWRGLDGCV